MGLAPTLVIFNALVSPRSLTTNLKFSEDSQPRIGIFGIPSGWTFFCSLAATKKISFDFFSSAY
jgi:hypothetical protein